VEEGDTTLLVDTGPDVKAQLLDAGVSRLDGILYTHIHADHTHGIDEIRAVNRLQGSVINAYGTENDLNHLSKIFFYIFEPPGKHNGKPSFYKPCLKACAITYGKTFKAGDIEVLPFAQDHGFMMSTGYRFGDIAYTTDAVDLPEEAYSALSGVKTWIIGCLQHKLHPTHAHFDRIMEWIERVGPTQAVLTHLSMRIDYQELADQLPEHITAGYDGLVIQG
jgi:phosphoribosyl 1,2-cyclic phosphate phosphodiesterase